MRILLLLLFISAPLHSRGADLSSCFVNSYNSEHFKSCIDEHFTNELDQSEPDYDCSVLRNYRDRDGNFTCPVENFDVCLEEYGPRLPPPYFEFVKHWCWCNCIYDPDDI